MAATQSAAFSAAIQTAVQQKVLATLRDKLVWASDSLSEAGRFQDNTDKLMFRSYPDLSITTPLTPLTEGTAPTVRAITQDTTLISTSQYGDLVGITDIVRTVAPADVPRVVAEKASRTADEVIDRVTRDAIFAGGTYFTPTAADTARTDIGTSDFMTGAALMRLRARMVTLKIPKFADGSYHLYTGTAMAYDIQRDTTDDTGWLDVNKYASPDTIIKGEVGKLHGIRIIETNTAPTFASTQTVSAGVCVGDLKGWGSGDLQTLATYHNPPGYGADPLRQNESVGYPMGLAA